jgi:hypothetical protein
MTTDRLLAPHGGRTLMIAAPVVDEVAGPPPGDDGTGRHQLVKHDLALAITRPKVGDLGFSVAEPLLQPHAANSSRVRLCRHPDR